MRLPLSAALLACLSSASFAVPFTLPVSEARPFAELKQRGRIVCSSYLDGVNCDVRPGDYVLFTFSPTWRDTEETRVTVTGQESRLLLTGRPHTHVVTTETCSGQTVCAAECEFRPDLEGRGQRPRVSDLISTPDTTVRSTGGSCLAKVDGVVVPAASQTIVEDVVLHECRTDDEAEIVAQVNCEYLFLPEL